MSYIYKIINTKTQDFYIGKTEKLIEDRFRAHLVNAKKGVDTYLYRAIRKYGAEHFTVVVIEEVFDDDELDSREKYFIAEMSPVYNMTAGGDGGSTTHNRVWVNDGVNNKYILSEDLLPEGFKRGRINCKFNDISFQKEMNSRVDRSMIDYAAVSKKAIATRKRNGTQHDISGESNPTKKPDVRLKISNYAKNRPQVVCPVCGKQGQASPGMYRFHFNNCKYDDNKS